MMVGGKDGRALFSPLVEQAIELAARWHDGTYRKSQWRPPLMPSPDPDDLVPVPVMAHLTTVALLVDRAGWDDVTVAAAFLHDALEDTNRHGQQLRYEVLRERMGEAVARLVRDVTEQKYDEQGRRRSWEERKADYLARLRTATPAAVAISLADKLHNLWTINQSLQAGVDVFTDGPGRRALSAGPEAQLRFHRALLELAAGHDDPRLEPLRARLAHEVERFARRVASGQG
ncbi:HD domain-containing protein [Rhodothermus marinus]|uniref:Metal dependent phosphohydrolase n=1 Tax=Rhodothermus marinus (strain ATCC 43812 / DSM 4252 / R-10) TaxID=518766 RepID=D0MFP1_RHOM4|nr:HD domain-containing protein [Rhodothermus marinus]ACY47568.1 metal dependent phosphohydrolase [Rhodothermus marinus DSM 4252]